MYVKRQENICTNKRIIKDYCYKSDAADATCTSEEPKHNEVLCPSEFSVFPQDPEVRLYY